MPKRVNKSKEDIAREMEVRRKRRIVVDKFFPALVGATVSVSEARMLISSTASLMMEDVLQTMKERQFTDLKAKLLKSLCPNGDREKEISALLDTLDGENLFVAREIIEGMNNAIAQMIEDDMTGRTLNSFTPDWDRMLNK